MGMLDRNNMCRKFSLRVHKFSFQWDLALHLSVCIASLCPFFFTGDRLYSFLPLSVWAFYHVLFLLGPKQANLVIPGFGKFKHSFKNTIEDFFSPKLLPVLSISFLLVALSLGVTGHRLGGPPLCYHPCGTCLALWDHAIALGDTAATEFEPYRHGCGYANGKELLGYYTMAQTSFLLFFTVVVAMSVCLAWRVADEEHEERNAAETWLKRDSPTAYSLRATLLQQCGAPASSIRPEGGPVWVFFGMIAAISFTLLGWHHWYVLPPSETATLVIILNLLTIIMTTLILHLGFFGRILALYSRNYQRVACLTKNLHDLDLSEVDSWWNCRNFVLNDDLSLDYDIGGLAVSATFLINLMVFVILVVQIIREGWSHTALLESPGSYCAYACMYITSCLIKIFSLATATYEEQHRHIVELQALLIKSMPRSNDEDRIEAYPKFELPGHRETVQGWDEEDVVGGIDIDEEASDQHSLLPSRGGHHPAKRDIESSGGSAAANTVSTGGIHHSNGEDRQMMKAPPSISRQSSATTENYRQTIIEIISQIRYEVFMRPRLSSLTHPMAVEQKI